MPARGGLIKAVILAGGMGSRLAEETSTRPKPMVQIGTKPIIWHIMKILSMQGIDEFVICCGYKGYMIKEYFANYFLHTLDFTVDLKNNSLEVIDGDAEPWRVTLVDTGEQTPTGGRLRQVRHLVDDAPFLLTYGDGLADIDLPALQAFHRAHPGTATVTAVQPTGRFGVLQTQGDRVDRFTEKPSGDGAWVSGGFFVLEPECLDEVTGADIAWEREPVERLAAAGKLHTYRHHGFWQPMDTLRDKHMLEQMWATGKAPWRSW